MLSDLYVISVSICLPCAQLFLIANSHSLLEECAGKNRIEEKRRVIITCSRLKVIVGGGLPSPWQRISTVSPSLTRPLGDSFHISMLNVGSETYTHTQNETINGGPFRNMLPRQCGFVTNHLVKSNKEGTFQSRVMAGATRI